MNEELVRQIRDAAQARLEQVARLMEAGVWVIDPTTV